MKKRQGYIALSSYEPLRDEDGLLICLNCKKHLPKRRRKYCSDECRNEWATKHYHSWLRSKLIVDKKNRCDECKKKFPSDELILDHIVPIACDGEEFNENNLQILCKYCNKIKTKRDHRKIAEVRNKEKIMIRGQENGQKTIVGFCPSGADNNDFKAHKSSPKDCIFNDCRFYNRTDGSCNAPDDIKKEYKCNPS